MALFKLIQIVPSEQIPGFGGRMPGEFLAALFRRVKNNGLNMEDDDETMQNGGGWFFAHRHRWLWEAFAGERHF
jgi:hypothetical protein